MSKVTHLTVEEGGGQNRRRIHLREISGDSDSPLETVGQDLRAARLRRGDDLATVSKALKIRKDHLEALEEDRDESLPGRTYAVGFIRSYAEYLGLDARHFVERFKSQIAGRTEEPTPHITVIDDYDQRRLPQGWKIVAAVLLLIVGYGIYYVVAPAADRMMAPAVTPVPAQMTAVVVPTKKAPVKPAPAPIAAVAPSAPSPTPAALPPIPAGGRVYGQLNQNPRIVLRMHKPSTVKVQSPDGVIFINRELQAGDSYQVPNHPGLALTAGDAGAVEIDLDGAAMGTAGQTGQAVVAQSIDPQAVADRYNHR